MLAFILLFGTGYKIIQSVNLWAPESTSGIGKEGEIVTTVIKASTWQSEQQWETGLLTSSLRCKPGVAVPSLLQRPRN